MSGRGSTNGKVFGVNQRAYGFYMSGDQPDTDSNLEIAADKETDTKGRAMYWQRRGEEPWTWNFEADVYRPDWWAICDSGGTPLSIWESESVGNIMRNGESPLETAWSNRPVQNGGTAVQLAWLNSTKHTTLEALVSAASIPAWATGSTYDDITDPDELLRVLFTEKQTESGLEIFNTQTLMFARSMTSEMRHRYSLLWLRSASQILHNHEGETLVPLAMNRFTVDLTTGAVTV